MEEKNMTALVSAFSRAYHTKHNDVKIFHDSLAEKIFTEEEYTDISRNMTMGIKYFNPEFQGTEEEALRWIVDNQLSPSPLGRAAYTEKSLENAVNIGAKQYLIFAAGYDTFPYRQPDYGKKLEIFEIDYPLTSKDKQKRVIAMNKPIPSNLHYITADFRDSNWHNNLVSCKSFNKDKISFCSLLGISYYLSKEDFVSLISKISTLVSEGSSIIFDYPDENNYKVTAGERAKKQAALAAKSGEKMLGRYSYGEIEEILSTCGFLIYEHLSPQEITEQYFKEYNDANPKHKMKAFDNVNYSLAVKKSK